MTTALLAPGVKYTRQHQCQMQYGPNATLCPETDVRSGLFYYQNHRRALIRFQSEGQDAAVIHRCSESSLLSAVCLCRTCVRFSGARWTVPVAPNWTHR